ncbi:MAG TPA: sigma-70 family RNA polymerase sigma factor [Nannocystaceae bacterium]|nr:sigma-70 family RNA polymerase sigma factor [Nannocystaceae bacterium]
MGGNDLDLLAAWRGGDALAGNELMERHYPSVLRFFALKVPASAEDLAQRTFLGCVEGLERLREDASFKAFLFAVARRQLLWHLRDKRRDDGRKTPGHAVDDLSVPSGSGVLATREEHLLLLRALAVLPDELQTIVQLHYWEEMASSEIEMALGVPSSTVRGRLSRARQLLAEHVAALGRGSRAAATLADDIEGWTRALVQRGPPAG